MQANSDGHPLADWQGFLRGQERVGESTMVSIARPS